MIRTRLRAGRAGRALIALFIALGALVGPVVMSTAPAYAGDGGWYDDPGPGNSYDDPRNGGGGGGGVGNCRGTLIFLGSKKQYEGAYHNCPHSHGAVQGYNPVLCNTGFEVYRFYGTVSNPTQAVVRAQLNRPTNCAQTEAKYRFAGTSPFDSGDLPADQRLAPWHADGPGINPDMYSMYQANNWDSALADKVKVWRFQSDDPNSGLQGKLTDGVVADRVNGTNCKNAEQPNGFRKDLEDPNVQPAVKKAIGALLWNTYKTLAHNFDNQSDITYALTKMGMSSFTTNFSDSNPLRDLARDANGNYTDTFNITWDNLHCSSPFDFVSPAQQPGQGNDAVTGVCYIPTMWSARLYQLGSLKNPTYWYDWSAVESTWQPGGLRYSDFYANYQGSAAKPDMPLGWDKRDISNGVFNAWRNAMAADYGKRIGWGSHLFDNPNGTRTQVAPAQPYKGYNADPWNWQAAANVLKQDSVCHFADHVSWGTVTNPPDPAPQVSETINVNVPPAFQVGGMLREQVVTAQAGPMLCNNKACPPADRLHMLHYRLAVTGTGGYRQCAAGQSWGCDFAVTQGPSVLTGDNEIQQSQQIHIIFYNPTMPTQAVKVEVKDIAATFEHDWKVTTPQGSLTGPFGESITLASQVIHGTDVKPFNPTVSGAPKLAPVIGASDLPR